MNLFERLFRKNQSPIECPRCLGKGHVDWDDIKRLKKELKWIPGSCAYCNGTGKIHVENKEKVPVDTTYLVNNLSAHERKMLFHGQPDVWERALRYDEQVDDLINQICFLHFEGGLKSSLIAEFYLLSKKEMDTYQHEKAELTESIEKMLAAKTNKKQ